MFNLLKLKRNKAIIGIHIVDKQIKIVEAARKGHGIELLNLHSISLNGNTIQNGKITDEEAVANELGHAVQMLGLKGANVHLTVPTSNVAIRRSVFASLKDKELRNLIDVDLHGSSVLPFKDPVFDFIRLGEPEQEFQEAAATAEEPTKSKKAVGQEEVLVFATPAEIVESYCQVIIDAGLEPYSVELVPLAMYRLLVTSSRMSGTTLKQRMMLINAEDDHADISIFSQGVPVFLRSVTLQSNYLIDSTQDQTEAYGRNLSMELGRIMNYYKYSLAKNQEEIEQMFFIGDPARIDAVIAQLQTVTDADKARLPLQAVHNFDEAKHLGFAVPVGLALKGA